MLFILGKILSKIIFERLKNALDKTFREEQSGFRQDCSYTDHTATMRSIIEQYLDWQTPLYAVFVDFQKAFDSVDRDVILILRLSTKVYKHHPATCQVIHDEKLLEPFSVQTGFCQSCLLSPTFFLMVVD